MEFKIKENKTEVVTVRLTAQEKKDLAALAKESGFTQSDMLRICLNYYLSKNK